MKRFLATVLLLALLFGMLIHHGPAWNENKPYVTPVQLSSDYKAHVGEEFYAWTEVVATGSETMLVKMGSGDNTVRLTVRDQPPGVAVGDTVQVYGILKPGHEVEPKRMIVSEQSRLTYLYIISAIGALLTGLLGLKWWRIDWSRLVIEPRKKEDAGA